MSKLKSIQTKISIDKSKAEVWDMVFIRFGEVNNFNPLIEGSHDLPGVKAQAGCERQCNLDSRGKKYLHERITDVRGNNSFDIEIVKGGLPMMDKMYATFNLVEKESTKTEVSFIMDYTTKPMFLAGMMKVPMKNKLKTMLIGLKYHLETGNIVSKRNIKKVVREYKRGMKNGSFNYSTDLELKMA